MPNAATARFCDAHGGVARWVGVVQRASEPLIQRFGMLRDVSGSFARNLNFLPLFTPEQPRPEQPEYAIEYTARYAGESAKRIHALEGAFEVTRQLAAGARPDPGNASS